MKLEEMLRRVHANSANLFHGRSPLSEICNDLILAQSMRRGPSTPTLLACSALVVVSNDALGRAAHVGDYNADTRIQTDSHEVSPLFGSAKRAIIAMPMRT